MNDIELQDLIARYKGVNPKSVVGMETLSTQYYVDTLLKKYMVSLLLMVFQITGNMITCYRIYLLTVLLV